MKIIILGLIGVAVVAGGVYWSSNWKAKNNEKVQDNKMAIGSTSKDTNPDGNSMSGEEGIIEKAVETIEKKDSQEVETNNVVAKKEIVIKKSGSFVKLENTNISKLDGKIVLDFSATWCSSCQAIKKDIEASLSDIPADVTIILVDYDTNQDLRVKYGVTGQHTFVQVKNTGEKIKLWRGGTTLESIIENIQ